VNAVPTPDAITLGAVIASAGTAAVVDLRTRRIPNAITGGAAILGLCLGAAGLSGVPAWSCGAGLVLGAALLLPGYLAGGTGGGDVKLLASQGAILGAGGVVTAFLYGAIAGGILALAVAAGRGGLRPALHGAAALVRAPARGRRRAIGRRDNRFPYGPAIAIGSILAALGGAA
jgi:prepilin peptidase CpaA